MEFDVRCEARHNVTERRECVEAEFYAMWLYFVLLILETLRLPSTYFHTTC